MSLQASARAGADPPWHAVSAGYLGWMRGFVVVVSAVALGVTSWGGMADRGAHAARGGSGFHDGRSAAACSGRRARATRWRVVVVVLENHSYSQGAGSSPYLNQLAHELRPGGE